MGVVKADRTNSRVGIVFLLVLLLALTSAADAANLSGHKYNDLNHDGNFDSNFEPLLPGWTISLLYANNNTATGLSTVTDSNGLYSIQNINPNYDYLVHEDIQPGWFCTNFPSGNRTLFFGNGSAVWNETVFTNCDNCLQNRIPPPQVLFAGESRFGDNKAGSTAGGSNNEFELMYPQGQIYNLGNTHDFSQTHLVWQNGTTYDFNLTYYPNGTVSYLVTDGPTVISANVLGHATDQLNSPIRDVVVHVMSQQDGARAVISDIKLHSPNGVSYTVQNGTLTVDYTNGPYDRINLLLRADYILHDRGGMNINQGFSITGKQMFSWDVSGKPGSLPGPFDLLYDIYIGRMDLPTNESQFSNFGNYQLVGNVNGLKWDDVDGDGIIDLGGPALSGWTITVSNATYTNSTVTDANGEYSMWGIPYGTYTVNEVQQAGWRQTTGPYTVTIGSTSLIVNHTDFGNQPIPGNITGFKFDNLHNALPGWTITLSNTTATMSNTTAGDGSFFFGNLSWDTYKLNETPKSGWTQLTPNATIAINGTNLIGQYNFTNSNATPLGTVSGYKFDGSGAPLSGWNITVANTMTGLIAGYNSTGSNGGYVIRNISFGEYFLNETPKTGWFQKTPNITISINATALNLVYNFTNTIIKGNITGYKFDESGNPLDGWWISAINTTTGVTRGQAVTAADGSYAIRNLPLGPYWLNETLTSGFTQTTPNTIITLTDTVTDVVYNFTNARVPGSISGHKKDSLGNPLSGWNITARNRTTGALSGFNITGPDGSYNITHLPWGGYNVTEVAQTGWTQIYPTDPDYYISSINSGSINVINRDFINIRLAGNMTGYKQDSSGNPLAGWIFTLSNTSGFSSTSPATGADGKFSFNGLGFGDYLLNETPQAGWTQGTPNTTLTVDSTHLEIVYNFTNTRQSGTITGYKIDQSNQPIPDWPVTLYNGTTLVESGTTDAAGKYSFANLAWGNVYNVTEGSLPGYNPAGLQYINGIEISGTTLNPGPYNFTNTRQSGSIIGYKVDQANQPIAGWPVTLYNSTALVESGTTDATGKYSFANLAWGNAYNVTEGSLPGYVPTGPQYYNGIEISGTTLNPGPYNFTNTRQSGSIIGYKVDQANQPIAGWPVTLYNGMALVESGTTDSTGKYSFTNLAWGNAYNVTEGSLPGYVPTGPQYYNGIEISGTTLNPGPYNFTNTRQSGSITGYKVDQSNQPIPDWPIMLYNGTTSVESGTTDSTGKYNFANLAWGNAYNVTEGSQPGYTPAGPQYYNGIEINGTTLNPGPYNFTNTRQSGSITGYKVDQANQPIPDWPVSLYNGTTFVESQTTDPTGKYSFGSLAWGNAYNVTEGSLPGYTPTGPQYYNGIEISGTTLNPGPYNFTNTRQSGSITGYKVDQANQPIPDWPVSLYNGTTFVESQTTDPTGKYSFGSLAWGNAYNVTEGSLPGYTPTGPQYYNGIEISGTTLNPGPYNFTNTRQSGSIIGYKVDQANQPIAGWPVTLYNGTALVESGTTDATGKYSFANLVWGNAYNVTEGSLPGYVPTGPQYYNGIEISGTTLNPGPYNFTNTRQSGSIIGYKVDQTNQPIPDWPVTLYNGTTLVESGTTDAAGKYSFGSLAWGSAYNVTEGSQAGYTPAGPQYYNGIEISGTTLNPGPYNFTNTRLNGGITGYKVDQNNQPIPDWPVTLYNGTTLVESGTTDAAGKYSFGSLAWGNAYNVTEGSLPGYTPAGPQYYNGIEISGTTLNPGPYNFTNTRLNGGITGYKVDQSNQPITGWPVTLYNGTTLVESRTTDANGQYSFANLAWGTAYNVSEGSQAGYTPAGPQYYNGIEISGITLNPGPYNFTNRQILGTKNGILFNDLNGNGIQDVNEKPLSGWVVVLKFSNGTVFKTETTDVNGFYEFTDIPWGTYNLMVTIKSQWTQTMPKSGSYQNTINATNAYALGENFGLLRSVSCCSCPTSAYFTLTKEPTPAHTIKFNDQSTGNPVQWFWTFGDGKTSSLRNPSHTYAKKGTYTVKEKVKGMDCKGKTYWVTYKKTIKVP